MVALERNLAQDTPAICGTTAKKKRARLSDNFVCLEGPMVVETRAPRHVYRLLPGERCAVPPKTAHYVHGEADGPCKFLIVQGVGVYDFVAVGG